MVGRPHSPFLDNRTSGHLDPEKLAFLLEADEEETIKSAPDTFLRLIDATTLLTSSILLDAALPTKAAVLETFSRYHYVQSKFAAEQVNTFWDLRRQLDSIQPQRDWDSGFRLVVAILGENWNAARFLLQHGADVSWAQEKGMEHFPPVLSALESAPSPIVMGHRAYEGLLTRWNGQDSQTKTDIRTLMFSEDRM
jgi:hypothetical protein